MMHWALPLIGKPWVKGATGPNSYDCWGLVCQVQRQQRGIEMKPLAVGQMLSPEHRKNLYEQVRHSHWYAQEGGTEPAEFDILLTLTKGQPHVGVLIKVDGQIRVLHAVGTEESPGAVIHSSLQELREGWGRYDLWRYIKDKND